MKVNIKKLHTDAKVPRYASSGAAGADLYALLPEALVIAPHETRAVPTGIAVAIPTGYVGLIYARSGLACKQDLAPANKVGVIDADYRGELIVALHNHGKEGRTVLPGDRIAQLVIVPVLCPEFCLCDALDETERGAGGFGSTGN